MKKIVKWIAVALILGALILVLPDARPLLIESLSWIDSLGGVGWAIFILIYILATILFIPGSILTLGAGFLWGVFWGTVIVSIASILGASAAFLLGRYLARDRIRKKVKSEKFRALDKAVAREGWKVVLLTRLSPILPFNALNYSYSLTGVSFRHYFWASWIGMLPWTIVYVYIGSLASDIILLGRHERTPLELLVLGIGLFITGILVWYVARLARRELEKKTSG